jgi:hypothetical protein
MGQLGPRGRRGGPQDRVRPAATVIASCLNGLLTLTGVAYAWRGRRAAMYLLLAALAVALVLNVPAYFLDAPLWVLVIATAILVLMVAGIALAAPLLRRRQTQLIGS